MPSGPPELHEKWRKYGPHEDSGDSNAIKFLKDRGWQLGRDWFWTQPHQSHVTTEDEASAIDYLVLEWDFGGIRYREAVT